MTVPLHFVMLGGRRDEKGVQEAIAAAEEVLASRWGKRCRFTIQDGYLSSEAYGALLASADVVLLPYHRDVYEARSSGVFIEAVCAGKIVIVTQDTWMSDMLAIAGSGRLVEDRNVSSLVDAIHYLLIDSTYARTTAEQGAGYWRRIHNAENLVAHLSGRSLASAAVKARAALIYPWGNLVDGRSGAAVRANLMLRELKARYREVRVIDAPPNCWGRAWKLLNVASRLLLRESPVHLWLHLWSWRDRAFVTRLREACEWADDVFLEYSFFAPLCPQPHKVTLTQPDILSSQVRSRLLRWLTRKAEFAALRRAGRVVVVTKDDRAACEREGIAAEVIPHPIDIPPPLDPEAARQIVGLRLPGVGPFCFFIGSRYAPNTKAARRMLEFATLMPQFDFVVAGDCAPVDRIGNYHALGRVSPTLLAALYRCAALVVIPLEEGTGASIKTIEALAHGCLVLSSQVGRRGLPTVAAQHCFIEADIDAFPWRIGEIAAEFRPLIRENARKLGAEFDSRAVLARYWE